MTVLSPPQELIQNISERKGDLEKERAEEKPWIPVGTPRAVNYLAAYSFRTEFNIFGPTLCPQDVAARGLDLPKVDCVVQYTGPLSARDYVHRIGRTARAGTSGSAVIFLTPPEVEFVRMLESKRIRINQVDMENILGKLIGPLSKYRSVQEAAIALQREFEALLLEDRKLHGKACKAYVSWMRFYSTYPHDMREIFNRKELHLGHYAKSFGLSDRPQQIGEIGKKLCEQDTKVQPNNRLTIDRPDRKTHGKQDGVHHNTRTLKKVRMLNVSEYDSGLPVIKKPKKF